MDYLQTPQQIEYSRQWAQISASLELGAALAIFVGLIGTAMASVIRLDGTRRALAIASLVCLVWLAIDATTVEFDPRPDKFSFVALIGMLFMTLISVVFWPSRSRWINWPLISGSGAAAALVLVSVIGRPSYGYF